MLFVAFGVCYLLKYQLIGPSEIWMKFWTCNFQADSCGWWLRHPLWNCPNMKVTGLHWLSVNIGSGDGLVPSTSHYLSQCWPSSLSPYCVTRPQCVNVTIWNVEKHVIPWQDGALCKMSIESIAATGCAFIICVNRKYKDYVFGRC